MGVFDKAVDVLVQHVEIEVLGQRTIVPRVGLWTLGPKTRFLPAYLVVLATAYWITRLDPGLSDCRIRKGLSQQGVYASTAVLSQRADRTVDPRGVKGGPLS